ncbi:hypothetical protein JCM10450v2_006952 [Rhodotorula kratochvilovae]
MTSFLSLSVELVELVFEELLDGPPAVNLATLRRVQRVCRAFISPARRLIFRDIEIRQASRAIQLIKVLRRNRSFGSLVKSLVLHVSVFDSCLSERAQNNLLRLLPELAHLGTVCPPFAPTSSGRAVKGSLPPTLSSTALQYRALEIFGRRAPTPSYSDSDGGGRSSEHPYCTSDAAPLLLRLSATLTTLVLKGHHDFNRWPTSDFPSLRSLSLTDGNYPPVFLDEIPRAIPSLQALYLGRVYTDARAVVRLPHALGARLVELGLHSSGDDYEDAADPASMFGEVVGSLTQLEILSLGALTTNDDTFGIIPRTVRYLTYTHPYSGVPLFVDVLHDALDTNLGQLRSLELRGVGAELDFSPPDPAIAGLVALPTAGLRRLHVYGVEVHDDVAFARLLDQHAPDLRSFAWHHTSFPRSYVVGRRALRTFELGSVYRLESDFLAPRTQGAGAGALSTFLSGLPELHTLRLAFDSGVPATHFAPLVRRLAREARLSRFDLLGDIRSSAARDLAWNDAALLDEIFAACREEGVELLINSRPTVTSGEIVRALGSAGPLYD